MAHEELVSDEVASEIQKAVNLLASSSVKRLDGDCWKVYTVGSDVIRVDIQTNERGQ